MAYSEDLRHRVRAYLASGGSPSEAINLFQVSRTSIYRWQTDPSPAQKPGRKSPDKIDNVELLKDVRSHPDRLIKERAETFGMSISGMWTALHRLGIKKNAEIQGT